MIPTGPPLISSLGAGRSSAQGNRSNPKGINFLSVIFVGETGARNLKPEGDGDHLRDDWGNHFLVFLDANQNGSLEIQVSQKRLNVASPIAVWCLGPNGVFDGQEGDDTYVY